MKKLLVVLMLLICATANAQVAGTCVNGQTPSGSFNFMQLTSDYNLKVQIYGEFAYSPSISTWTLVATNTVTFLASLTGTLTPPCAVEIVAYNKLHHGVATTTAATVRNYVYMSQNDIKVYKIKTATNFNQAIVADATTGPATMAVNIYQLE